MNTTRVHCRLVCRLKFVTNGYLDCFISEETNGAATILAYAIFLSYSSTWNPLEWWKWNVSCILSFYFHFLTDSALSAGTYTHRFQGGLRALPLLPSPPPLLAVCALLWVSALAPQTLCARPVPFFFFFFVGLLSGFGPNIVVLFRAGPGLGLSHLGPSRVGP